MTKCVNIRLMKKSETDAIASLWNKLSYNQMSRDIYYKKNLQFLLNINMNEYYSTCFFNPNCFIFVAEYEGKLIGFVEMWLYKKDFFFNYEDYAYILNGFVDKVKLNVNPLSVPFKLFYAC